MEGVFGSMNWLVALLSFVFGIQFRALAARRFQDQAPNPKNYYCQHKSISTLLIQVVGKW
jgi:hypothetical protein